MSELEIVQFSFDIDHTESFHFIEQSSLQILREVPPEAFVDIVKVSSQRHRIVQKIANIRAARTAKELNNLLMELVDNGSLPIDELILKLSNEMELQSFDDFQVKLTSRNSKSWLKLMQRIFKRNDYSESLLSDIMNQPKWFHKIGQSNQIEGSYKTLDEALERL